MNVHANAAGVGPSAEIESSYAWLRLAAALALGTIGSIGMWSFVVALPAVQAGFGVARADASLPFTLTMIGFGLGGVAMGRFADRYGIVLILTLVGIAYTSLTRQPLALYWELLVPVLALVCVGSGWHAAPDRKAKLRLVATQVAH